ncbi:MAG: hypothetical protein HY461_02615 [Parcubacteria group bacterium]|nr:hypothetical protein [Parcubacteria group bacterium]
MFFQEKVHPRVVLKWGILAGILEGAYIAIAAILYSQHVRLFAVAGWERVAAGILLLLIAISAIVTTVIVFAHPLYSLSRRQYREALLTVLVTLLTLSAVSGLIWLVF